jgi:hypothetical protein
MSLKRALYFGINGNLYLAEVISLVGLDVLKNVIRLCKLHHNYILRIKIIWNQHLKRKSVLGCKNEK